MKDIEQVKQSIKDSAVELFEKFGFDKTTLDDIAKNAGRAKTLVYYHFGSKKDLLKVALEEEFQHIQDSLQEVKDGDYDKIMNQLIAYLEVRMQLFHNTRVYKKYALESIVSGKGEVNQLVGEIRERYDEWEKEYFRSICAVGKEVGALSDNVQPESFANMISMLLKGLEVQFLITDDWDGCKATYDEVVEKLLMGCQAISPCDNR